MRFTVSDPLTPKQAWWVVAGCILGVVALIVAMEFMRPTLDRETEKMIQRKESIERSHIR